MSSPVAGWEHEIVLDPKLEAADFRLDPPAGYAYEAIAKPTITEEEMVAFLGAAARFNDGVFPDSPFAAFDQAKFNAASRKADDCPDARRTGADRAPRQVPHARGLHSAAPAVRGGPHRARLLPLRRRRGHGSARPIGSSAGSRPRGRQNTGPCSRTSPSGTSIGRNSRSTWRSDAGESHVGNGGPLTLLIAALRVSLNMGKTCPHPRAGQQYG